MSKTRQFFKEMNTRRVKANLAFILVAALMLELIVGILFFYSRHLLQVELEENAEEELEEKATILNSSRSLLEITLVNHIWDMERYLSEPDSMFGVAEWILRYNPEIMAAGIAFTPYYYPQKGRLFEPYAYRQNDSIIHKQLAGDRHDYTQSDIYRNAVEYQKESWSRSYFDSVATCKNIITYSIPIRNRAKAVIAVLGLDIETTYLGDTLNADNRYSSSYVLLLDEQGDLIAGPDTSQVSKLCSDNVIRVIYDDKVHGRASINDECTIKHFKDPDDGYPGFVFYSDMGESTNWRMAVVCYEDEVFGPLLRMRIFVGILILISLVVLTLVIMRFVRNDIRLEKAHTEQERISTELRVANEIQQSMLPQQHLSLDNVELCGLLVPAREVGGDLFDYFVRDEKLYFCIGDVSGKGAPAAMLMAVTHSLFRAFSAHENNPAHIMQALNEASCQNNEQCMFVTLFIGVLDLPTGRLRYCDAGHDAPIVLSDGIETLGCQTHLPIGVFADTHYSVQETILPADSSVFLYTDGLTEAMNYDHQQFGLQRVTEVMQTCVNQHLSPKETIETVTHSVHTFTDGNEQSDDLTMLAVHYTPTRFNSTLSEMLVIRNDVHEITRFSTFVKSVTDQLGLDPTLAGQFRLAAEEAVVNVIEYAYPDDTTGDISVQIESDGRILRVTISDSGTPFDPTAKEKVDTTLSAEERQTGGLGIFLYRELMDSINYERTEGKNILTLTKKL